MAIAAVVDIARLDDGWILAPERYDPRRRRAENAGPCVGDFVHVRREVVRAGADATRRFLVFDTGDAKDGIMAAGKPPVAGSQIRSAKKRIHPRQVVVSRLRPYLRQIAWVDPGLLVAQDSSAGEREGASRQLAVPGEMAPSVELICSTEFFVLESADGASIAFLVPFLLSAPVQAVLAAAQEGGHHPRFNERTLTTLAVPAALAEQAGELSGRVERAVGQAREAYAALRSAVATAARLQL